LKEIISFEPTRSQLSEIKNWLQRAYEEEGDGFYCNWRIIAESMKQKELVTVSIGKTTVGFLVYSLNELTATIDILEIQKKYRKRRLGRKLVQAVFEYFKVKGVCVLDLQCAPASSEKFWKKLGFIDIPESHEVKANGNKELYKTIVADLRPTSSARNISAEIIELWDSEPRIAVNSEANWSWQVKFNRGTRELSKPIVQPAYRDWRLKWSIDGKVLKDDKVKYFGQDIDFGKFMIIRSLPGH